MLAESVSQGAATEHDNLAVCSIRYCTKQHNMWLDGLLPIKLIKFVVCVY